ncbi:Hypothetical_protein [Hexamita inflata]|uniref:Hypothetical_protein n=1 Tax=Hexamita inflata TaxID=28002 RepID=A0AA86PXH8_9EUKA|nr:Hypothetical protein HINF_LOCUS34588 [Hexamita inflata]
MPFIIIQDESQMNITWCEDKQQQNNYIKIKDSYNYINITGYNQIQFDDFEIFRKSERIGITNCSLNFSKLIGDLQYFSLDNCNCIDYNDEHSNKILNNQLQLNINHLVLTNTQLYTNQLSSIKLNRLSIQVNEYDIFDYWNCGQLKCKLLHLSLHKINIDLSVLNGHWDYVLLNFCQFSSFPTNKFSTQHLEVNISNFNNFNKLSNLQCTQIQVYASSQEINKQCFFDQKYIGRIEATIENITCNISQISDSYKQFEFINCNFIGTNNQISDLSSIKILISDDRKLDLHSLFDIDFNFLKIHIDQINIKCLDIVRCNPNVLQLSDCTFDLVLLKGKWKEIKIITSAVTNADCACNVIADEVEITDSLISDFHCFQVNKMILGQTQTITSFPRAKRLLILKSKINLLQANETIQRLQLVKVKITRFSLRMMSGLLNIQFSKYKSDYFSKTKNGEFNKFIQNKNKLLKMNMKNIHRVQHQSFKKKTSLERQNVLIEQMSCVIHIIQLQQDVISE